MSNETKWTPGPWSINEDASGDIFISSADGHYVAEIGAPEDDSALPDANLIAAAPEVYDACLDLLAWHDVLADPQWHGSPSQTKAITALAKARGEV